ncbi:MAG TPA: TonB family protein [Terriglobales bacterium]|nr:TonB family protein [Terriglobales bacterium]
MVPSSSARADDPDPQEPSGSVASHGLATSGKLRAITSKLASHGIQSGDLVLDLLLHDIAEEIREATGANGAAIALQRDGDFVCRAAAGATAPDLGIRINASSGLSALCILRREQQVCSDTESDDRVDVEACRRLGVRSIVVVPITSGQHVVGILEVFAAHPNAFGGEDFQALHKAAASVAYRLAFTADEMTVVETQSEAAAVTHSGVTLPAQPEAPSDAASSERPTRPVDPLVPKLRFAVLALSIVVCLAIGFDWGWRKAHRPQAHAPDATAGPALPSSSQASSETETDNRLAGDGIGLVKRPAKPLLKGEEVPPGGLAIYDKGKLVYRQTPLVANKGASAEASATEAKSSSSSSVSGTRDGLIEGKLLHSVRPKYPAEAVEKHIEGSVLLHGIVGKDGTIRDLNALSGDPLLSHAALEAVLQWRYEPYRRNGEAIDMPIDITIDFNLGK